MKEGNVAFLSLLSLQFYFGASYLTNLTDNPTIFRFLAEYKWQIKQIFTSHIECSNFLDLL